MLGSAHAALVWDSSRPFRVTPEEEAVAAAAAAAADAAAAVDGGGGGGGGGELAQAESAVVAGGVVGVWRRNGRGQGVGRWPSPQPAVPSLD
jgi:hypothetical protein